MGPGYRDVDQVVVTQLEELGARYAPIQKFVVCPLPEPIYSWGRQDLVPRDTPRFRFSE